MKKRALFGFVLMAILMVSCNKEPQKISVTGITVNPSSLSMVEGESQNIVATVSPSNANNQSVIWTSSDGTVASVNNGKVTALKEGKATITAKSDDGGYTASCSVTVNPKKVEVESITLSQTSLTLAEGDSETLVATVKPDNATDKNVTWSSSDASIITVNDGKVTAVKEGSATITANAGDKSATCSVIVTKKEIAVESIELSKKELDLIEGETATLIATVKPDTATDKTVTWTTSDPTIATIENGKVTALKEGKATITAKAGNESETCEVTVSKKVIPVIGVTINKSSLVLKEGETEVLVATVSPDDATDKTVSWTISNTAVATVDENGKVTALSAGSATITVTTTDGNKTATCSVTVSQTVYPVTGISLSKSSISMTEGDTATLEATVTPSNATDKTVAWSSSNNSVVTVVDGTLTAKSAGTATVTAMAGDKTATCRVTVSSKIIEVTGITLDKSSLKISIGSTETIVATITPVNATNKNLIWSSSDTNVATVNGGVVTAKAVGIATITVKAQGTSITATCNIEVTDESSGSTEPIEGGDDPDNKW